MAVFSNLLAKLPKSTETRMSTQGYVLWFSWQGELDPVINQTLQNYGGMSIVSDHVQAVWFFFNKDVFLALARLSVWARFNEISASVQLMNGRLQFGLRQEISLNLDAKLEQQELFPGKSFDIAIHSKAMDGDMNFPGITFEKAPLKQGMAVAEWATIEADTRLPYTSSQGWYAILRPLGNPLDPAFQKSWPAMQYALVETMKLHKLKFLVHNDYMMVMVESLLLLRTWLAEMLAKVDDTKENSPEEFWPFLSVVIDRKGLNFNNDLYKKVGLQWNKLSPDFPYMSYRTGYLLGEGFAVQDIRFSNNHTTMDAWCTVALLDVVASSPSLHVLMAGGLTTGEEKNCFFCGINTHTTQNCPTIRLPHKELDEPSTASNLELEAINAAFRDIERSTKEGVVPYDGILDAGNDSTELLKAIFDINFYSQPRALPYMWLTKGRDVAGMRQAESLQRDEHVVWEFYDKFIKLDGESAYDLIAKVQDALTRNQRDMRMRMLLGFMYIYMGRFEKAQAALKEAATLTGLPIMQAWVEYLQARLAEVQEHYLEAITQYNQILRVSPQWKEVTYRKIVCKIKMGFVEQELTNITKLIKEEPLLFNRYLIDPEIGRGRLMILTHLYPLWKDTELLADAETKKAELLNEKVGQWFPQAHPSHVLLQSYLQGLMRIAHTKNYVTFLEIIKQRPLLEKKIEEFIQRQVEELQERYKFYLKELQSVRDEASWFPFPKMLRDFSDEFNEAAAVLNWAFGSNFQQAENFQKAQANVKEVEDLLRALKKRLKTLRALRDGTLFGMTFLKTFMWVEAVGLILCFVGVPSIMMFGHTVGLGWLKGILANQQWEIQKVLVGIVTLISFGLAMLRSTITFERQRDKFLRQAKEQRERLQDERLERIRKKKQAEAERAAAERKAAEKEALRRRYEGR